MTHEHGPIDIVCSTLTHPSDAENRPVNRPGARSHQAPCSRRAAYEIIGLLAAGHNGLHRDLNGTWWTGDRAVQLAQPVDRDRWAVLNQIARSLGYAA